MTRDTLVYERFVRGAALASVGEAALASLGVGFGDVHDARMDALLRWVDARTGGGTQFSPSSYPRPTDGDAFVCLLQAESAFLDGQFHRAWALLESMPTTAAPIPSACQPFLTHLRSTTAVALARALPHGERGLLIASATQSLETLGGCTEHRAWSALLQAELASLSGDTKSAMTHFDAAVARARETSSLYSEAVANERAGAFHEDLGLLTMAQVYASRARVAFRKWGARSTAQQPQRRLDADEWPLSTASPSSRDVHALDQDSLLKAVGALSEELVMERLGERLLAIVAENAGADRGFLLVTTPAGLVVEASFEASSERTVPRGTKAENAPLCAAALTYVERTGETSLSDEPARDPRFAGDPHIVRCAPRALLCAPLEHQRNTVGVIYLENTLTPAVFTRTVVSSVMTLASHAALAIHNAHLYATLESRVASRAAELLAQKRRLENALIDLRETQDRLFETERHAALGRIVTGVAHELGTPIGNAVIASSTLEDAIRSLEASRLGAGVRKTELESFLELTRESSGLLQGNLERVERLLETFKTVAVDRASERRRPFALRAVIEHTVWTLAPEIARAGHVVHISCAETIELDSFPGPLGQVIANLVTNSLVHAFEGRLDGCIEVLAVAEGAMVTIVVRDDGAGIPLDAKGRIFDPFFTTKLGKGGNGLGLHICHNLVTSILGGSLVLEEDSARGASFRLTLPLVAPAAANRESAQSGVRVGT